MKKFTTIILLTLGLLLLWQFLQVSPKEENEDVIGVIDQQEELEQDLYEVVEIPEPNTIVVEKDKVQQHVRMIGVDMPDTHECFSTDSLSKLQDLILNEHVDLLKDGTQGDIDSKDRLLRYIYLDNIDVNLLMVEEGYAFEYTHVIPYERQKIYIESEKSAKEEFLGLWDLDKCDYP